MRVSEPPTQDRPAAKTALESAFMKRLVEFPLEGGGSILVETDEPSVEGGVVRAGREGEVAEKAGCTFQEALSKVTPAAHAIITRLRGLSDPPDQVGVEFGLKLSAAAGAIVA